MNLILNSCVQNAESPASQVADLSKIPKIENFEFSKNPMSSPFSYPIHPQVHFYPGIISIQTFAFKNFVIFAITGYMLSWTAGLT